MAIQMMTGTVAVSSKLFKGIEWQTDKAESVASVEHAATLLARWSQMYGRPEPINTDRGAKFWFRDAHDYNLLIVISGASVNDLRAAYRAARA